MESPVSLKSTVATLAVEFRRMQFEAHNAHNLTSGPTFFSDHEFLGGLYATYEDCYDSLVERMIGFGWKPDLVKFQQRAVDKLQSPVSSKPEHLFGLLLGCEREICDLVEKASKQEPCQGLMNLLAQMADDAEVRIYKIQQRLGGATSSA